MSFNMGTVANNRLAPVAFDERNEYRFCDNHHQSLHASPPVDIDARQGTCWLVLSRLNLFRAAIWGSLCGF